MPKRDHEPTPLELKQDIEDASHHGRRPIVIHLKSRTAIRNFMVLQVTEIEGGYVIGYVERRMVMGSQRRQQHQSTQRIKFEEISEVRER